jgi:four helix bundle protein
MNKTELQERLKAFALRCYKLTSSLPMTSGGKYFQNQLMRASMSAYANYRAACIGQSKAVFIAKLSIAFEEADECCIWLDMIIETETLPRDKVDLILKEAKELASILAVSRKNSQQSLNVISNI